jgi:hypothetical protein
MIKINWKQYVRDRKWFGFSYIECEITDMREWGFMAGGGIGLMDAKLWVIKQLNRYA